MRTFLDIFPLAKRRSTARTGANRRELGGGHFRLARSRLTQGFAAERGDTLIEVLVSAVIIALIVVGTLTGLDSTNRATALQRSRSQAAALAEQDEEQLRSEPVLQLSEISKTHEARLREVTENGTRYDITSTAQYKSDATATASCTSATPKADYIQTTSTVTWPSMGVSKPVVETSIVSPPPGSALIASVTGASGEPVPGMQVTATGSSNLTGTTTTNGCAILAVSPGEYSLNVSRSGFVDQNDYSNSSEDPSYNSSFYVIAESTAKKRFEFAPAGELAVYFENPSSKVRVAGDTFVTANTGMSPPAYKAFGELGQSPTPVSSGYRIFPFTSSYSVYAGSCPADAPAANGQSNPTVTVPAGKRIEATVPLPSMSRIVVKSGTTQGSSTVEGNPVNGAEGTLIDTGCEAEGIKNIKRTFTTNVEGKPFLPGIPYGKYSLCVSATLSSGKSYKTTVPITNNSPAGPETKVIYLGAGTLASGCP
jgi:Tfp pilus assembly protein PilV